MTRILAALAALVMLVTLGAAPAAASGGVFYQAHVQDIGDQSVVFDGATAGTTGRSLRMEGVRVYGAPVEYRVHSQDVGWGPWVQDAWAGTKGRSLRAEAVQVRMAASADPALHVEYRAHIQNIGWGPWVSDGAVAGTTGRSLRMEALQVRLVYRAPAPTPTPGQGVRLAVTADTGIDARATRLFASIADQHPDLTAILGDLAYEPNREADYCALANRAAPLALTPGTHEGVAVGDGAYSAYLACSDTVDADMRRGHYYLDRGPVRLVMLSPGVDLPQGTLTYGRGTSEREQAKNWIDEAKAAGRWVVVGMHHGCLTVGVHGCSSDPSLTDMLIGKKVDLILTGHDHNYGRSHQLAGTSSAPVVVDRDGRFKAGAGTVLAVVGNGGHNARPLGAVGSYWARAYGTDSAGGMTYGHLLIDADEDSLSARLNTYEGPGADIFTIER